MTNSKFWKMLLNMIVWIGVDPDDNDDIRLQKEILVGTTLIIIVAGILWGAMYLLLNEPTAALIPFAYSFISVINVVVYKAFRHYRAFRFMQLILILLLPFFLMIALGGFVNSSAVILWSLLAPLGALMCCKSPQSVYWFIFYVGLLLIGAMIDPYIRAENNLPHEFIIAFLAINIGAVSAITFVVLNYFVRQKDLAIELMRKHRELEKAYLQQEITLRQNEKLATLGKLSSGIAHELNNPAAAALRNVKLLAETLDKLERSEYKLGQMDLSPAQFGLLEVHNRKVRHRALKPVPLDPLARNELEDEMERWLGERGIAEPRDAAPILVELDYSSEELTELAENFKGERFPAVAALLCNLYTSHNLLGDIGKGIARITEIVKALNSYTFLDQAPVQSIDIHDGLNDTLVIFQGELGDRIKVRREYAPDLPNIEAYGSELNQVWTNIIDNAIGVIDGEGEIVIRTERRDNWAVVEIIDSGPGIPGDIQIKIFDPFFTTKPPGVGTGLGLNIAHNIIVQKHNGEISVRSKPGETCFQVKLPITDGALRIPGDPSRNEGPLT